MQDNLKYFSDEALWEHYRNSDEIAFAELFRRHYRKLLHYGLKFTPDQQEAEDCIQELMIRLWTKRLIVNDTESVKHYLLKSYRHILFKKLKQMKTYEAHSDDTRYPEERMSIEEDIIQNETSLLLQERVKSLLNNLTPRQREILYLRFYQNLTPPEIASMLQINAQSVCNIIQRAFVKIRESANRSAFDINFSLFLGIQFLFF